eukprot:NODE_2123_length_832_cov_125.634738_g1491_i0.p4 GENE.NODE_2123_length_832_cov_125.634738_g1491_i0~~NODE_2123_length_832_cov_125.634738_g1491_i0.p4  ORF type:complete len:61 (+),score=8.91 NODE_2123_length_832_cov_125.634738_g1491_i0:605-787(+)
MFEMQHSTLFFFLFRFAFAFAVHSSSGFLLAGGPSASFPPPLSLWNGILFFLLPVVAGTA